MRWLVVSLLTLFALLGLANVFGQNPTHSTGTGDVATLDVSAPNRLRGGVFYQGRFSIHAKQEIAKATLLLDSGWFESMHIKHATHRSRLAPPTATGSWCWTTAMSLRATRSLSRGCSSRSTRRIVGHRSQGVELHDEDVPLAAVDRDVTIFP